MNGIWRCGIVREPSSRECPPGVLVVKVGGSLLGRDGWPAEIRELLGSVSGPRLVVVGGGPLVDGLRTIDAAAAQPTEVMHRLAIEAMGLTARLVADCLQMPLVGEFVPGHVAAVLDPPAWLRAAERMRSLPVGWHVTSDSIAAGVAESLGGGLLLAKSAAPPCPSGDLVPLAASGWVDAWFPTAARSLAWIGWAAPATRTAGR
jgi:hypothetical protein